MNATIFALTMTGLLVSSNVWAASTSQYNMSLQDKVITGPKGSLTSPQAASVNKLGQMDEKSVRKIADGIYRIGGWGIANIIAVEAPEGWNKALGDTNLKDHTHKNIARPNNDTFYFAAMIDVRQES